MTKPRSRSSPAPRSAPNGTKTFDQRYPAAGTPNVAVACVSSTRTAADVPRSTSAPNPDIYLARVDWSKDGRTLYVQRESRDQKRLDLLAVDPATGASRVLFTETSQDLDQPQRRFPGR